MRVARGIVVLMSVTVVEGSGVEAAWVSER